jgi:hypothetical protein
MKRIFIFFFVLSQMAFLFQAAGELRGWSPHAADAWAKQTGWLVGCNYIPSTAENDLEMWQADTFDPVTIDRELGWAQGLGFNCIRVFLHDLLWQQDSKGFLARMNQFLAIADKHHLKVVFVIFDSCWDPNPRLGPQPPPRPFVHNSRWVQCPGREYLAHPERLDELKPYVQGVIGHFRDDKRIAFWDLYNEPNNLNEFSYASEEPTNKLESVMLLLKKTFAWARQLKPEQPFTSGVWDDWSNPKTPASAEIIKFQLSESDIITFHAYGRLKNFERIVQDLRRYGRPLVCTEYTVRLMGTFNPILGWFRGQNVGALDWGFVSGKTQTIYPWDSWQKPYTTNSPLPFFDIFHQDGSPYRPAEVDYIRSITMPEK